MINPMNLVKVDETDIRDSSGSTLHVGSLPEYDTEDYDLTNQKDLERYFKDIKSEVRSSFEYREYIKYLKLYGGMDRSGLNPNITNFDGHKVKIEIHHTPLVLEDIVRTVYEKRKFYHEDLSVEMVAKEVMECHYKCIVGLFPLTATEHELVHNGYLFIPPENVFGRYNEFVNSYKEFMEPEEVDTIEEIEEYGKSESFNVEDQNRILSQSNIYIDSNGAYEMPRFDVLKDSINNRIETIKNNMYSLPTMSEQNMISERKLIPAIYYVDENGEKVE